MAELEMWMHTAKAVRQLEGNSLATAPPDRVFLVVGRVHLSGEDQRAYDEGRGRKAILEKYSLTKKQLETGRYAWKCRLTPQGLRHPAFVKPLKLTETDVLRGCIERGRNGSHPNAEFSPDSFYRRVTLEELEELRSRIGTWRGWP